MWWPSCYNQPTTSGILGDATPSPSSTHPGDFSHMEGRLSLWDLRLPEGRGCMCPFSNDIVLCFKILISLYTHPKNCLSSLTSCLMRSFRLVPRVAQRGLRRRPTQAALTTWRGASGSLKGTHRVGITQPHPCEKHACRVGRADICHEGESEHIKEPQGQK